MRNVVLMVVVLAIGCQAGNVKLSEEDGKVRVTIDGQLFTEYNYREGFRPYCYPIIGPLGTAMTRDWPMRDNDYDKKDHPHHKGLWFAHGTVNGINFWGIRDNCGKTIHDKTLEMTSGESRAVLRTSNKWVAPDGREILRDERTLVFHADSAARMIDFSIKLIASAGEVNFADTKEGTMALRVATAMNADGKGNGKIVNSEGLQDGAT